MQHREGDAWVDSPIDRYNWRNYDVFAILAGVRNYEDRFEPIAAPRGFPEGFVVDEHWYHFNGPRPPAVAEDDGDWMGDHSYSWLTLAELLAHPWDREHDTRRDRAETDAEAASGFYTEFIPRLIQLAGGLALGPEQVRIVFGFDN